MLKAPIDLLPERKRLEELPLLKLGRDIPAWVTALQHLLAWHGVNCSALTPGVFDRRLEVLVKNFQKENKLVDDGVVGYNTWKTLLQITTVPPVPSKNLTTGSHAWRIENHRLVGANFRQTPNVGGKIQVHRSVIIHFTAGRSAEQSINWLCQRGAGASAHLVIGRDGTVTQLAGFDQITWHAGVSSWNYPPTVFGLNSCTIGIELDNKGLLTSTPTGWKPWFNDIVPNTEVMVAKHKNGGPAHGWHTYTSAQMSALVDVTKEIMRCYGIKSVLGHDDISPGRKNDPGPAFDMSLFKSQIGAV